jgi:hypothetical protein
MWGRSEPVFGYSALDRAALANRGPMEVSFALTLLEDVLGSVAATLDAGLKRFDFPEDGVSF